MINNALPDAFEDHHEHAWHAPRPTRVPWSVRLKMLAAQVAEWFRTRIVRRLRQPAVGVVKRIPVAQLPPDDQPPQLLPPTPPRLLEVRRAAPKALPAATAGGRLAVAPSVPQRRSVIFTLPPPDFDPGVDYVPLPPPQGFCRETVLLDEAAAAKGRLQVLRRAPKVIRARVEAEPEDEPLMMLLPAPEPTPATPAPQPMAVVQAPASVPNTPASALPPLAAQSSEPIVRRRKPNSIVTLSRPAAAVVVPRSSSVAVERASADASIEDGWIGADERADVVPLPSELVADAARVSLSLPETKVDDAALLLPAGDPEPQLHFDVAAELPAEFSAELPSPFDCGDDVEVPSAEEDVALRLEFGAAEDEAPAAEDVTASRPAEVGAELLQPLDACDDVEARSAEEDVALPLEFGAAEDEAAAAEDATAVPPAALSAELHSPLDAGDDVELPSMEEDVAPRLECGAAEDEAPVADGATAVPPADFSAELSSPLDAGEDVEVLSAEEVVAVRLEFGAAEDEAPVADDVSAAPPTEIGAWLELRSIEDAATGVGVVARSLEFAEKPDASPAEVGALLDLRSIEDALPTVEVAARSLEFAQEPAAPPVEIAPVVEQATDPSSDPLEWLAEPELAQVVGDAPGFDAPAEAPASVMVSPAVAVDEPYLPSASRVELESAPAVVERLALDVPARRFEAEAAPSAEVVSTSRRTVRRVVYVQDGAVLPLSARRVRRTMARVSSKRRPGEAAAMEAVAAAAHPVPSPSTEAFHDDGL